MIDFAEKARQAKQADEILKMIDAAMLDNFDKFEIVSSQVNDLEIAKVIIKRLLSR